MNFNKSNLTSPVWATPYWNQYKYDEVNKVIVYFGNLKEQQLEKFKEHINNCHEGYTIENIRSFFSPEQLEKLDSAMKSLDASMHKYQEIMDDLLE